MIKGGGDIVANWIWRLCNMAFESAVPEDRRFRCSRVKERGPSVGIIDVSAY